MSRNFLSNDNCLLNNGFLLEFSFDLDVDVLLWLFDSSNCSSSHFLFRNFLLHLELRLLLRHEFLLGNISSSGWFDQGTREMLLLLAAEQEWKAEKRKTAEQREETEPPPALAESSLLGGRGFHSGPDGWRGRPGNLRLRFLELDMMDISRVFRDDSLVVNGFYDNRLRRWRNSH